VRGAAHTRTANRRVTGSKRLDAKSSTPALRPDPGYRSSCYRSDLHNPRLARAICPARRCRSLRRSFPHGRGRPPREADIARCMHRDPGDTAPESYPASYTCPLTCAGPVKDPPTNGHGWCSLASCLWQLQATAKKVSYQLKRAITKDPILAARRASREAFSSNHSPTILLCHG